MLSRVVPQVAGWSQTRIDSLNFFKNYFYSYCLCLSSMSQESTIHRLSRSSRFRQFNHLRNCFLSNYYFGVFFTKGHSLNGSLHIYHVYLILMSLEYGITNLFHSPKFFWERGVVCYIGTDDLVKFGGGYDTLTPNRIADRMSRTTEASRSGRRAERSRNAPRMRASDIRPHCPPYAVLTVVPHRRRLFRPFVLRLYLRKKPPCTVFHGPHDDTPWNNRHRHG